jgi:hypothetical protein
MTLKITVVSGLCPLSDILKTRKHISETGSVSETCFLVFRILGDGQKSPKTQ